MLMLSQRHEFTKRDLAPNVNFFMNVPVTPEELTFADGVSGPGRYVELTALAPVTVLKQIATAYMWSLQMKRY